MINKFSKVNQGQNNLMNLKVIVNYSKPTLKIFFIPLFFLIFIVLFLYSKDALSVDKYVLIQKDYFYLINSKLSQFPNTIYNLTQLGDALIILSILSVLFINVPKMWESLLTATIISAIFSKELKDFFSIPRPAEFYDKNSFIIIGEPLHGFSSFPSGHSITIFTTLTILMFAFMPQERYYKILWCCLMICTGLLIASTRVGVGAHHPLDVLVGSVVGFISGLIGIFMSRKFNIWTWIANKKYYPLFILLYLICSIVLITKIVHENLIIYYFTLIALIVSLYKIIYVYVKK